MLGEIVKELGNIVGSSGSEIGNIGQQAGQQARELVQGSDSSDVAAALGMNEETSPVTGIQQQMTTRQRRSDQVAA
jgi:hypothetical protein